MAPPKATPFKVQLPPLESGPLPLHSIREQARRGLLDLIDSRRGGRKALLLDPSLSGPLGCLDARVTDLLAEHGVARIHYADGRPLDDPGFNPPGMDTRLLDMRTVLWLIRPTAANTQRVAAQVKSLRGKQGASVPQDLCVCFVPRRTIACNRILEEEGVWGDVVVCDWGLELVPLEEDVLSLELEGGFKECVLEGDSTSLYYMARAIMRLQTLWGIIPRLQGKGPAAVAVRDMVLRMRRENPGLITPPADGGSGPLISRAILIDREVDLVTPCMTQITLEGLVDEVTGIKGGSVPWAAKDRRAAEAALGGFSDLPSLTPSTGPSAGPTPGSTLLNSTDPYYKEFRDLPYHVAITRLQSAAREARREYEVLASKDLSQLRTFVKGLPKLMLLDRLSDIAAPVAEQVRQQLFHDRLKHELDAVEGVEQDAGLAFIQELILRGAALLDVLRLMVLVSVTSGGLPRRALESLREDLLVAYGYEHYLTISAMERAGLLRVATSGRPPFQSARKTLKLVVPEPEGATPDTPAVDISHIYKGYAPLSIRLVEAALAPTGWGRPGSALGEALAALPGTSYDITQPAHLAAGSSPAAAAMDTSVSSTSSTGGAAASRGGVAGAAAGGPAGTSSSGAASGDGEGAVVLVVFLGGVTYSEISALRWLSTQSQTRFLILTSQVINGRSLLSGFIEPAITRASKAIGMQQATVR